MDYKDHQEAYPAALQPEQAVTAYRHLPALYKRDCKKAKKPSLDNLLRLCEVLNLELLADRDER